MADQKKFCQIGTSDGHDYYLLSTIRDEGKDGISLILCDGSSAWSGNVDGADLVHTSKTLKMKPNEYLEQTCKALRGEHGAGMNFQYEVKKKGGTTDISWKKTVSGIKFQLGSVTLQSESDTSEIVQDIFEYCIKSCRDQDDQIRTLEANKDRLSTERANALKRLEKCTAAKEALETDLYSKFQTIINGKKVKLREIYQELEEVKNNAPVQSTSNNTKTDKGKKTAKRRQLSPSPKLEAMNGSDADSNADNLSDYHSDDSTPPPLPKQMRRNAIVPVEDDNPLLFLDDEEEEKEKAAPLARRQRRQRESQKKQTPAKPVIPKVSSSKKVSLIRGSSGSSSGSAGRSSRRSVAEVDADDLMDLM